MPPQVREGDQEMDDLRSELQTLQLEIQTKALAGNSRIHELQVQLKRNSRFFQFAESQPQTTHIPNARESRR